MAEGPATVDRIERERTFHDDRFGGDDTTDRDRFYDHVDSAVDALHQATDRFGPGDRILELGCGANSLGWELSARGCDVTAIDISPVAVERFEQSARAEGLDSIRFLAMNAEELEFADGSFDGIVGTGILHHLDLHRAYAEVARVMAPTGTGVFYEPLGHNPLINAYRNRTPDMRTLDEHPLLRRDLRLAGEHFGGVDTSMHECAALGAALLPERVGRRVRPLLAGVDHVFLRLPGLRWLAWITVIELRDPQRP